MPHYKLELSYLPHPVCGVDEAGCGPWAGPVVAAAVFFPTRKAVPRGLDDSKKLTKEERETLLLRLQDRPDIEIGIGIATVEEIDTLNIWGATALAMHRAVSLLSTTPIVALIDGKRIPRQLTCQVHTVIGGDGISLSIAAASIVAKVTRDKMMAEYAAIHRRSFRPIRELLEVA